MLLECFGDVSKCALGMYITLFQNVLQLFRGCLHIFETVWGCFVIVCANVFEISLAVLSEMQGCFQIVWELNVFASIFVCGVVTHPAKTFPRRASRADFP